MIILPLKIVKKKQKKNKHSFFNESLFQIKIETRPLKSAFESKIAPPGESTEENRDACWIL